MIAEYSSYIELLAAVYISMLLDVEALKKLWYPDGYYNKIENALKKELPEEETLNERIVKASQNNADSRNRRMRRRAAFMLMLTALLLALLGFESSFDRNNLLLYTGWYNSVLITYFLGVLVCFFSRKSFDNWNTTAWTALLILVLFIILSVVKVTLPFIQAWILYYPIVIVILVTLPVLFEIFSLWIFSSVYSGYLRGYVMTVKSKYDMAMVALKTNDKKLMPREYRNLINKSIYSANNNKTLSDICIQGYVDIRNNKLTEISQYPNGVLIFLSWIKYTCYRCLRWVGGLFSKRKTETIAQTGNTVAPHRGVDDSQVVVLNYQKEYDEYMVERSKFKGKLSVKAFCRSHGYDADAMITWLKQRKNINNANRNSC